MDRQKQILGVKQALIECYLHHESKQKVSYHHEVRTKEVKQLYDSMFSDFQTKLEQVRRWQDELGS
ncbi:hypothetical protein [Alkalibacillus almallahensis]|uniref:hypothetical protein n=1 Tax=Alkalibacillus almallahensis TaxID=1379154 RepID=UPI0014247982|nr:hypothetical protein [Alkalibacillus almallahensis]NIK10888.1 hypothetical protein [Alkalibacillus almallahensis]